MKLLAGELAMQRFSCGASGGKCIASQTQWKDLYLFEWKKIQQN